MSGFLGLSVSTILGGGVWVMVARLFSQVAQLVAFVAAARVLSPAEFGFFAFVSAIAFLFVVVSEGGWAEYIMRADHGEEHLPQLASIALVSGCCFTLMGFLVSLLIGGLWFSAWQTWLFLLFSLWFIPAALNTVYDGTLVHRNRLNRQAVIRIVAEAAGLAVTLFGLWAGWNIVALVLGRLVTNFLAVAGGVLVLGWIVPAWPDRSVLGEVLHFARYIVSVRIIVFGRSYSGTLAVGGLLGLADAGYYRAAERIVAAFSELVGEPARMLAWVIFRRAGGQSADDQTADPISRAGNLFLPALFAVAAPVYVGLILVAPNLVDIALGATWAPVALVVKILAVRQLLSFQGYVTEPLLSVRGEVRRLWPLSLMISIASIGMMVVLAPFGLVYAAIGQCVAAGFAGVLAIWFQSRYGKLDWPRITANSGLIALAAAVMFVGVSSLAHWPAETHMPPYSQMAMQVLVGATIYLAVLYASWKWTGWLKSGH
ncbi:oligosaccharide flippase family protein [Nitratireductor aquibiodomus]|uniref:Membrane protein involved in the export of O-antigen and teichoic acid n=1 Tax=Nitratireductor aquibiodomus TaxID=204799 RepID=A0A1H4MTV3_9HYPH|nr:oligosaccharide flippase family protein [Nitratireductor aquibiodomus]SEB86429.1 Membrane protein involved in the export of O-antigen and teichoic acid [Nitratireductor aquibiodomus]